MGMSVEFAAAGRKQMTLTYLVELWLKCGIVGDNFKRKENVHDRQVDGTISPIL
jgi:hypothetical protein